MGKAPRALHVTRIRHQLLAPTEPISQVDGSIPRPTDSRGVRKSKNLFKGRNECRKFPARPREQ